MLFRISEFLKKRCIGLVGFLGTSNKVLFFDFEAKVVWFILTISYIYYSFRL